MLVKRDTRFTEFGAIIRVQNGRLEVARKVERWREPSRGAVALGPSLRNSHIIHRTIVLRSRKSRPNSFSRLSRLFWKVLYLAGWVLVYSRPTIRGGINPLLCNAPASSENVISLPPLLLPLQAYLNAKHVEGSSAVEDMRAQYKLDIQMDKLLKLDGLNGRRAESQGLLQWRIPAYLQQNENTFRLWWMLQLHRQ
ncbi:hypothetical protein KIN20_008387 [Parelaphostrongylus tenuis]|uniref:Uncharacterized protein n=1 Tax=Parelaphostrongylus tenuis TaxID=148309 RepID=A0AAD5MQF5_PARTN|nr:hypothetical protein KIN20_008387 [Parelaphostrongylus tenuis]